MSEMTKLREIVSIKKGKPPLSFDATAHSAIPYLSPEYLRGASDPTLAEPFPNSLLAREGEVILLWDGSNAGEAFRAKAGIVASTMALVTPIESIEPAYFFHLLKANQTHIKNQTNGTGIPHVDRFVLEEISFRPFFRAEQSKIAEVLDTLDEAIRGTEAVVAKLKAMKQGLLHDLLTRGIDANGNLRPAQSDAPHLYKQTPLGWLPKEWDARPLGDYTQYDITYGIVQAGPHIEGGIPYVRTGDMSGDELVRDTMLCTSERIARSYRRSEVRAGELIIAIRATLGKALLVPADLDGANLTQGTARIAPKASINAICLMWAIRHRRGQDAIMKEVKGSTFMEISLGALRVVLIGMPIERDEQDEIARRLAVHDEAISREQKLLEKLRLQKSGLMDDLLTGRTSVTALL